jgi:hypothetical protein
MISVGDLRASLICTILLNLKQSVQGYCLSLSVYRDNIQAM